MGLFLLGTATARAQDAAKPYMLLIMDTSGSMQDWETPGDRIYEAKQGLANAVQASGEVIWGLQRFGQICDPAAACNCVVGPSPGVEVCDDGNNVDNDGCSADCLSNESCGNGYVDWAVGEQCDDGNGNNGDGCDNNCQFETLPVCGDGAVDGWEVCDDGNNVDGDGCSADCLSDESCGNGFVDVPVGEECDDGNTVINDGCDITCAREAPSVCGDGVVGQGEQCDDGNTVDGDGCSADCRSDESCGNGVADPGEECDDWNTANGDGCSGNCQLTPPDWSCGNGNYQPWSDEMCDDGNNTGGDGCSANCSSDESCGNGYVDIIDVAVPEECDDGNTIDGDGCSSTCTREEPSVCGDGVVEGGETCDDGNTADGDGCSWDCRSDETCGNGVVDIAVGEACDDGNTTAGDGCDAGCQRESPGVCGDGTVNVGEACDDGNTTDGDGCSANCLSDESCGNGIVDVAAGEECDDSGNADCDGCDANCLRIIPSTCGDGVIDPGPSHATGCAGEWPVVELDPDNQEEILLWVNQNCDFAGGDPELLAAGGGTAWTPLGASLEMAHCYLQSVIPNDPYWGCRPYHVVLLTDGAETCDGDPVAAARMLYASGVPTLVIAFAMSASQQIDDIAAAGSGGQSCESLGFAGGALDCDPVSCGFDTSGCQAAPTCGDGTIDAGEQCDAADLGGQTCASLGLTGGTLACNPVSCGFDTSGCQAAPTCGNGQTDADEQCDGLSLGSTRQAIFIPGADQTALALELMNVISDSVLVEVCNGEDDDCDCPGDTNGDGEVCTCNLASSPPCDDGVDEGFPVGNPCDNGQTGACYREGMLVCRADTLGTVCNAPIVTPPEDPEVTCDGTDNDCDCPGDTNGDGCVCCAGDWNVDEGVTNACGFCGPLPEEVCDWLDNDCNGIVDDASGVGLLCAHPDAPGPVGDEGECELGTLQCQGEGPLVCVGEVGPTVEVCDCLDNDCDGDTDEPPGPGEPDLCPAGAACVDCWCVTPCLQGEFPCPQGYTCDANDLCVPDECTQAQCPPGTFCALDEFCQESDCTGACVGACGPNEYCLLADGTCHSKPCVDLCSRCDPDQQCVDGVCLDDDCRNFPEYCAEAEICVDASCIPDACLEMECEQDQFCREGECIDACAFIHCDSNQICVDGECIASLCAQAECAVGEVCDEETGECVADPCFLVDCGSGLVCIDGECVDDHCLYIRCPEGSVCENNECVAPAERNWIEETGCGCNGSGTGGSSLPAWPLWLGFIGLLLVVRRRPFPTRLVAVVGVVGLGALLAAGCQTTWKCTDCYECVVTNDGSELCDGLDNDCDCPGDTNEDGWYCGPGDEGVDEDFDTDTDIFNCGVCGNLCNLENAFPACVGGDCVIDECLPGFYDGNQDPADGCEYRCVPTNEGVETCDGSDNDCDCPGDTNGDGCHCCLGDEGVDEDEEIPEAGLDCGIDEGACQIGVTSCVDGRLECTGEIQPTLETCDGTDNDCDGSVDENFYTKGDPCWRGVGVCQLEGAITCDATGTDVWCGCTEVIGGGVCDNIGDQMPQNGDLSAITTEIWNGDDDDCNGVPDDGIPAVENMTHIAYTHPAFGALDFWIYTYEASRPDATGMDPGVVDTHPQSVPGVLPWTVVSWQFASDACAAAGKRLCNEEEWQATCEGSLLSVWPYGNAHVAGACNDNVYDADPSTPEDDDAVWPTGDSTACVTEDGVFDMSGNVKEWTSTQVSTAPDAWRIRGGAFDSPADGARCAFNFSAAGGLYVFDNLGFRCCSDTAP